MNLITLISKLNVVLLVVVKVKSLRELGYAKR